MIRQSSAPSRPKTASPIARLHPFSKQSLAHAFRVMASPPLFALTFASVCPCPRNDGLLRRSDAHGGHSKTFRRLCRCCPSASAVLIFAGIRMMSGRFQDAIPGLFGRALLALAFLGWGAGWDRPLSPASRCRSCHAHDQNGEKPSAINQALNRPRAKLGP